MVLVFYLLNRNEDLLWGLVYFEKFNKKRKWRIILLLIFVISSSSKSNGDDGGGVIGGY